MVDIKFKPPGPVARRFMLSDAFVRGLRGPVGSAKSSTCVMECFRRMCMQKVGPDGKRRSRGAVIRNTNPMLRTTVIKTWEDWLKPEHFGDIKMAPPPFVHEINIGDIEAEVWFLSLDRPEDMRKLLSLELTWAFINEAREIGKTIVDGVTQRLRRYPAQKDGGFSWSGLIMDTNAPDEDHWWPIMAGEAPPPEGMSAEDIRNLVKPADWEFFTQPEAMLEQFDKDGNVIGYEINPEAENIQNLDPAYYSGMVPGKTKAWIDVYIMNRLGAINDGRPVQPQFRRTVHVAEEPLEPVQGIPIRWSFDFGLTPAALARQRVGNRWLVLKEIVLTGAGATDLAKAVNRSMADDFPGFKFGNCWGDPAGDQRAGTDKRTPFQVMRAAGIPARPTETNDPAIRRLALETPLTRMVDGAPGIVIDPRCRVTIAGLEGGWHYKRVQGGGSELFEDEPAKNRFSHPCEALEYGLLGDGEAREALGRKASATKTADTRRQTDPLDRLKASRKAGRRWGG